MGVFLFPYLMNWRGLPAAEIAASAVSVLGVAVTAMTLPETKGKSLEEVTGEKRPGTANREPQAQKPAA